MTLSAAGSALVAGATLETLTMPNPITRVRALRAFFHQRERVEIDDEIEVSPTFAAELIAAKKAEPALVAAPSKGENESC